MDSVSVQNVILYLKAYQKMFEGNFGKEGLGCKQPFLASVKDGLRFFSEWAHIVVEGILQRSYAGSTN